jgi:hypothetical protein
MNLSPMSLTRRRICQLSNTFKIHLAACAYDVKPIPFENVVISMLIEERKKAIALQEAIDKLNERLAKLETENAKVPSRMAL